MDFENSETKVNLMRAFAGESQARNRYTFAASAAKKQGLYVVEAAFQFTAGQEKEHAEIFYNHLSSLSGKSVMADGAYPVDADNNIAKLLRMAQHNEYEEHSPVYKSFGETAREEGFHKIAAAFFNIAEIEKTHGDRFGYLAQLLEDGRLLVSDVMCKWMCLNCGYIYEGEVVPEKCPVCEHDKGYFIRLELAPYTVKQ